MIARVQLANVLKAEGVKPRAYDLEADGRDEAYCLEETPTGWIVFYRERGLRRDEQVFASEEDACAHLLELVRRDPTTRR